MSQELETNLRTRISLAEGAPRSPISAIEVNMDRDGKRASLTISGNFEDATKRRLLGLYSKLG